MSEHSTWLNGERFTVDERTHESFKRVKKEFCCRLCGHTFKVGDSARWIYANGTPGMGTGNFFVCGSCDGPDEEVMPRAKESLTLAIKLAKQWGIYGPDWGHG